MGAEPNPAEPLLHLQRQGYNLAQLVTYRGAKDASQYRVVEQIFVCGLTAGAHAEAGVNFPGDNLAAWRQQPVSRAGRDAQGMRGAPDVELLAAAMKRDVSRHVANAGDHIEALIEGDDDPGAEGNSHLLPDVKHPTLGRDPGREVQAGVRPKLDLLRRQRGAAAGLERRQAEEKGGTLKDGLPQRSVPQVQGFPAENDVSL
jgi:hypothetical protein